MTDTLILVLIGLTLVGVAIGRYPRLRMNRATIALVGATALIGVGAIGLEEAFAAIDLGTLALLLAMMIINANLRLSGFFQLVGTYVARHSGTPLRLLFLVVFSSGLLSAFLLNDTIVLMFTPLVLDIVRACRRNPIPYLVALATAANLGSAGTIIGNPQNILIGTSSGISFVRFSLFLFPVALIGLSLAFLVIWTVYRSEFGNGTLHCSEPIPVRTFHPLLRKCLAVILLMTGAFFLEVNVSFAALAAASLLLITRRLKPERVFREIDWSLLVFFSGLFVVTGVLEVRGYSRWMFDFAAPLAQGGILPLAAVSVVLSNLVSNVPAVLLFRPLIPSFPEPEQAWLTLSMATTFAGNLTLIGSVANLIVAETARRYGVVLGFVEYLKGGLTVTLLSLLVGGFWLSLVT